MESNILHKKINFKYEDGKINKVRFIKLTKNINGIFNNKFNMIDENNNNFSKEIFQQKIFKK